MNPERFEVTDHSTGSTFECEGRADFEETLKQIFDMEQPGVAEAIEDIVRDAGYEYTGGSQAFLNISVEVLEVRVKDYYGNQVDYEAAVNIMDDDLREELHAELAPCTEQEFFDAYGKAHEERFGCEFEPYVNGQW